MSDLTYDAVELFLTRLRAAWDAADAASYAAQFTEGASYVTWRGDVLLGRREIERVHDQVFRVWSAPTMMATKVIQTTMLKPGIHVVLTAGGIGQQPPVAFDKIQTFVLVGADDTLLCSAFHNTVMNDAAKAVVT